MAMALPFAIGLGLVAADQFNQSIASVPKIASSQHDIDAKQRTQIEAKIEAADLHAKLTQHPPRVLPVGAKIQGQYPANLVRPREAVPYYPGIRTKKKTPQAFYQHPREWTNRMRGADPSSIIPLRLDPRKATKHGVPSWRSDPFMDNAGRVIGIDPGTFTKTVVPVNPIEARDQMIEARRKFRDKEIQLRNKKDIDGPVHEVEFSHRPSVNGALQYEAPSMMRERIGVKAGNKRITIYHKHRGTIDVPTEQYKSTTKAENTLHTYKSGYWKELDMPANMKGTGKKPIIDFQGMFDGSTLNQTRYQMFHTGGKRKRTELPRHSFSHGTVIPGEFRINGTRDASNVLAEPKKKKALGIAAPRVIVQHPGMNPHSYKTRHEPLVRKTQEFKKHTDMQAVSLNNFIDTSSSLVNRDQKFGLMRRQERTKVLVAYPGKQTWRPMEPMRRVEFIEAQKRNRYGVVPKYRN